MKKFLNILLLLGALGLVVACKPAGKDNARLKQLKQKEESVGPPIWDGDPEEILAQYGYFWWGPNPDDQYFVGFKKHNGELWAYVRGYYNTGWRDYVYPQHAEDFWPQAYKAFDQGEKDPGLGFTCWHKVKWGEDGTFTLPTLKQRYPVTYKLDTKNKSLQQNYTWLGKPHQGNLKKFSTALTTDYTPQVQALTEPGKTWGMGDSYESHTFYYDKAHKRLYYYCPYAKSKIKDALDKRDFKGDYWNIVCQDPENQDIFYGNHYNCHFIVEVANDSTIHQLWYYHQEDGEYWQFNGYQQTFSTGFKVDLE